jgi:hypothetical protein
MMRSLIFSLLFLAAVSVFGQRTPPDSSPTPVSIETIISQAEQQTANYRETFNNLLAQETKIFEEFGKNGEAKEHRVIESNFIVYQSIIDPTIISEYRNVVRVDGKEVSDNEQRTQDFFEKVLKSTTADKELQRIQNESNRYDKTLNISGLTLYQAPILLPHIRAAFSFEITGQDIVNGVEVYIISYTQKAKSPFVIFNDKQPKPRELWINFDFDLPGSIKDSNVFLRGIFWIDKQTFQIRREQREVVFQPNNSAGQFVAMKADFEYQKSEFGVLTPKKITLSDFDIKAKDKGREITTTLDSRATFEYTKFSKSDVEVKSNEINTPKN